MCVHWERVNDAHRGERERERESESVPRTVYNVFDSASDKEKEK